jgi:transcription initiation factor TFIID TATA-box-binding protein
MGKKASKQLLIVSNVVGTCKISEKLDLEKLFIELDNSSYEPEQFSGLTYRSNDPPGTVIIFQSGKAICTGAKDRSSCNKIISNLVKKLEFLDIPVNKNCEIQIKNMIFTKNLNQSLNLAKVALSFGLENIDYEPDDFPGLVYRTEEPHATLILFESGKVVCTGAVSEKHGEEAYNKLLKKLKRNKLIK